MPAPSLAARAAAPDIIGVRIVSLRISRSLASQAARRDRHQARGAGGEPPAAPSLRVPRADTERERCPDPRAFGNFGGLGCCLDL
jgi:hypothetical protein